MARKKERVVVVPLWPDLLCKELFGSQTNTMGRCFNASYVSFSEAKAAFFFLVSERQMPRFNKQKMTSISS